MVICRLKWPSSKFSSQHLGPINHSNVTAKESQPSFRLQTCRYGFTQLLEKKIKIQASDWWPCIFYLFVLIAADVLLLRHVPRGSRDSRWCTNGPWKSKQWHDWPANAGRKCWHLLTRTRNAFFTGKIQVKARRRIYGRAGIVPIL